MPSPQTEKQEALVCSICQSNVSDRFCSQCGQKCIRSEISLFQIIVDFIKSFFAVEKSVFYTVVKLIKSPILVIENYWAGYRNYFESPAKLILYSITFAGLHLWLIDDVIFGIEFLYEGFSTSTLIVLFLLPILILVSVISFLLKKKSIAHHMVSVSYLFGAWFLFYLFFSDLLRLLIGDMLDGIFYPFFFVSIFIFNSIVFNKEKGLLWILLGVILQLGVFIGIWVLVILAFYLYDPESFVFFGL